MSSAGVPTWEEVARDHGQFLFTVAYRLTGNVDEARDLVQEALLRVRRGLATYEPGSLEGWLARIVTNVFLDDMRAKKRRPVQALPENPDLVVPPSVAADDAADAAGLSTEIQAAIAALPEEFRVPVVLCDIADQSYEEIARATGVPIGTVRSRLHRGRKLLPRRAHDERGDRVTDDDLLSAYLDDELDAAERSRVEAILSGDDEHRAELDSLAEVRELVRGLAPPEPPVGWIDSLTAAVAAAGDEPVVADLEQRRRRRAPRVTAMGRGVGRRRGAAPRGRGPDRRPHPPGTCERRPGAPGRFRRRRRPRLRARTARCAPRVGPLMRRLVAAVVGVAAGLGLLLSVPGFAADANPADTMLDRAREALRTQEFSGRVRLEWWDGSKRHVATVDVATTDGVLQMADGRVVEHDGRSWMRTAHRWTTLWADDRDPKAPSISAKYRTRVRSGPTVAGRATRELVVRHADHVVERIAVDRRYGFVLARERYDDTGRPELAMRFVGLRAVRRRATVTSVPTVGTRSPTPIARPPRRTGASATGSCSSRRGASSAHEQQLRYSDGVFDTSIFTQRRRAGLAVAARRRPAGGVGRCEGAPLRDRGRNGGRVAVG